MKAPYRIVSEIYEEEADYPVVTHVFRGDTPEKAAKVFKAHLRTDAFFRNCVEKKKFRDFDCGERRVLESYVDGLGWAFTKTLVHLRKRTG